MAGWLPYGSADSSVLFQDTMTDRTTLMAKTGVTEIVAASDFDSVLGFRPQGHADSGNYHSLPTQNGSGGYLLTKIPNYRDLDDGGQISFEIEAKFVCTPETAIPLSEGYPAKILAGRTQPPTVLSIRDSANVYAPFFQVSESDTWKFPHQNKTGAGGNQFQDMYDLGYANGTWHTTAMYDEFVRVNIGWTKNGLGIHTYFALDGVICTHEWMLQAAVGGYFDRIYIGSNIGVNTYYQNMAYMRNLQISSKSPTFGRNANLGVVALWSDSLFNNASYSGTTAGAGIVGGSVRRNIAKYDLSIMNRILTRSDGGYGLVNGTPFVASDITQYHPRTVVFCGGTNDVTSGSGLNQTTFETNYKALMDDLIAYPSIKNIVCCTVPPIQNDSAHATAAHRTAVETANAMISGLPAYNSKISVCDLFTAFGGHYGATLLQNPDDMHWVAQGHIVAGAAIANSIKLLIK